MVKRNFNGKPNFWEKIRQKLIFVPVTALIFSLVLSLSKQLIAHTKANQRLLQKQTELAELEEKNKLLKEKLEEVSSPQFMEEQERRLLGTVQDDQITVFDKKEIKEPEATEEIPNYRKWWKLFFD